MAQFKPTRIKFNGSAVRLELGTLAGVTYYRLVERFEGAEVVTGLELATASWRRVEDRLMTTAREREDAAWLATH